MFKPTALNPTAAPFKPSFHTKEELEFCEEAAFDDSHPDDVVFMTAKEYEDFMASEIAAEMASKTSV